MKPLTDVINNAVFLCFQENDILTISEEQQLVLNIEERNRIIIDCMDQHTRNFLIKQCVECRK